MERWHIMKYANSNINYKKMMEIKKTIVGNAKEAFANKSALKEVKIQTGS